MVERIEERGDVKPGRPARRFDAVIRSIGLAWLVFAVLVAFAPARADIAPEKAPVAATFNPLGSTILQRDPAGIYFVGLRARLEWSRASDRSAFTDHAGHTGLAPALLQLHERALHAPSPRPQRLKTGRRVVRLFDARAPPRSV